MFYVWLFIARLSAILVSLKLIHIIFSIWETRDKQSADLAENKIVPKLSMQTRKNIKLCGKCILAENAVW